MRPVHRYGEYPGRERDADGMSFNLRRNRERKEGSPECQRIISPILLQRSRLSPRRLTRRAVPLEARNVLDKKIGNSDYV